MTANEWFAAARSNDINTIRKFLSQGFDINTVSSNGSALMIASDYDFHSLVRFLIENGASLEERDSLGYTALHNATSSGYFRIAELLIKHGARVNAITYGVVSPLELAVDNKDIPLIDLLLLNGSNPYLFHYAKKTMIEHLHLTNCTDVLRSICKHMDKFNEDDQRILKPYRLDSLFTNF
jgi:ankyrin repeat protein